MKSGALGFSLEVGGMNALEGAETGAGGTGTGPAGLANLLVEKS